MKKTKASIRRLTLEKETIRTLGDHELVAPSAGWECSVTGSGNIKCIALASGDPTCEPVES